jgi:hypothetical protein
MLSVAKHLVREREVCTAAKADFSCDSQIPVKLGAACLASGFLQKARQLDDQWYNAAKMQRYASA